MPRERLVCVDPRTTCLLFGKKNLANSIKFGIKIKNKFSNAVENCGIQKQWKVLLASKTVFTFHATTRPPDQFFWLKMLDNLTVLCKC